MNVGINVIKLIKLGKGEIYVFFMYLIIYILIFVVYVSN